MTAGGMGRSPITACGTDAPTGSASIPTSPLKALLALRQYSLKDQEILTSHLFPHLTPLYHFNQRLNYMEQQNMVITQDGEIKFITAYGPKLSPSLECGPGRTKQSFKDECDINVIMKRYEKTGVMPDYGGKEGRYIDCTGSDFQTAMTTVANARSLFAQLPAAIRNRFENDPAKMLDFVNDEANREEAAEMGLLKPKAEWTKVDATPPATTPAATPTEAPSKPEPQ